MQNDETLPCTALAEIENALLWSMRAWVIGHCRRKDVSGRIEAMMTHLGVPSAAACLDSFMGALSRGARRTIEVNCVCYPVVSADERDLLDVFALQQRDAPEDAYAILMRLTTEQAGKMACDSAQRLALLLAAAGRLLPAPSVDRIDRESIHAQAGPSRYLH